MLITSSADETVRFWDLGKKRQLKIINAVSRCKLLEKAPFIQLIQMNSGYKLYHNIAKGEAPRSRE